LLLFLQKKKSLSFCRSAAGFFCRSAAGFFFEKKGSKKLLPVQERTR
jgi:hypothetical protein